MQQPLTVRSHTALLQYQLRCPSSDKMCSDCPVTLLLVLKQLSDDGPSLKDAKQFCKILPNSGCKYLSVAILYKQEHISQMG